MIILFFISSIVWEAHAIKINCEFKIEYDEYECASMIRGNESDENEMELFGNHLGGRNGSDVKYFYLNNQNLTFFPRNIEKEFSGLKWINLSENLINCLTNAHLRPHRKLHYLYLDNNNITVIESNLFDGLPNLQSVYLNNNNIKHVNGDVKRPTKFYFSVLENPCIDRIYYRSNEITDLSSDLQYKCPPLTTTQALEPFRCSINGQTHQDLKLQNCETNCDENIFEMINQEIVDVKKNLQVTVANLEAKITNLVKKMDMLEQANVDLVKKVKTLQQANVV